MYLAKPFCGNTIVVMAILSRACSNIDEYIYHFDRLSGSWLRNHSSKIEHALLKIAATIVAVLPQNGFTKYIP